MLAAVTAAAVVAGAAGAWFVWSGAAIDTTGDVRFERELWIPPLIDPDRDSAGRKVFALDLREGQAELLNGQTAQTWGVNGPYLGPTLRARRGDEVAMRVHNSLPEVTTLHWHGMHLPPSADGGPHQMIEPGKTWEPGWRVDQPAATLWYHPHQMGKTEDHVYRGVAGMFILDDGRADALELPATYGVDDIPVIVQDARFGDDGELSHSQGLISPIGRLGDTILVNGTSRPYLRVGARRVRLRLLNASTARIYNFGFDDDRDFDVIATDGGLLPRPARVGRIQLSPGERAEIVVALEPGDDVVLRSFEPELGEVDFFNERFVGGDDSFDVLELRAADDLEAASDVPTQLARREAAPPSTTTRVRRFELSGSSSINGREMDMDRIDARVPVGTWELWEVKNRAGIPHSFHVHDARFEIIEIAGARPPAVMTGLKDTVLVPPGETVRLRTRFTDYTSPTEPYMFHCHLLEHEDRGMMGQFVVTDPSHSAVPHRTRSASVSASRRSMAL
jgi:FtsP/CotA-like multicopper oxidase with cupredoxin domain